jgi:hypothetical protein
MTKNMIGLPPGVTTTCAGSTGIPRVCATSSAIACRNCGMPAAGV